MRRVVVDTNVLIASIFWNGAPYRIIQLALDDGIEIITSKEILNEVRTVLKRDFHLTEQETDDLVNCILLYATVVEPTTKITVVRDPKDNMLLEAALDAQATSLITRDADLLVLGFYRQIKIISPEDFLS